MTKEERAARKAQRDAEKYAQRRAYRHAMLAKPGKLSKAGEWMRQHPDGLEGWFDMKAIMK
ncbi:MAG: hypothetical protein LBK07_05515 [Tannerella sp.]|nr:hypothetical protein [Tannerella sp.]